MPSLEEAIDGKYGSDETFDCHSSSITIYIPKKNPRNIIPSLLVLNDCDIDMAGSENLASKCEGVRELDLAQNKLTEWSQVLEIFQYMPHLQFVNLSFNDLSQALPGTTALYPHMKNLVLNSTHVPWETVRQLLKCMPTLEELHLSFNDFRTVDLCEKCEEERDRVIHEGVKKLHFTGNPIQTWYEVTKLGQSFPLLESLVIAECPIKNLDPGEAVEDAATGDESKTEERNYTRTESECESSKNKEDSAHNYFRFLKFLNVNYTSLESWDDVDRLGKFPALECLRIQGCPLFESSEYTEHERRQLLIARLGNVLTLNGGGVIKQEEREDAERAFIRYYMEKPESDRPDRYSDLVSVYGKLDPLVHIDLSPEKKVRVKFTHNSVSEARLVNVYLTVSELKHKLDGFDGIPSRKMKLFYVDQEMQSVLGPEEMRYPNKQLYSYNISNGDEIIIEARIGRNSSGNWQNTE